MEQNLDISIHNKLVDIKSDLQSVSERLNEVEKQTHDMLNDIDNSLEQLSESCYCQSISQLRNNIEEIRRKLF